MIKDMTDTRNKIKQALNINDNHYRYLVRMKGVIGKIEGLIDEINRSNANELRLKKIIRGKAKKIHSSTSVAMIDPITKEVIQEFVSITDAARHAKTRSHELLDHFDIYGAVGTFLGYEWKKIKPMKKCGICEQIFKLDDFPRNGVQSGKIRYRQECKDCLRIKRKQKKEKRND